MKVECAVLVFVVAAGLEGVVQGFGGGLAGRRGYVETGGEQELLLGSGVGRECTGVFTSGKRDLK